MKKIILLIISLVFINAIQAQIINSDSIKLELTKYLNQQKEKYQLPSLVLVLVQGDSIIYSKALGYADVEKKLPATIDSKYPIMSITKTFTATVLMQLYEEGKLSLYDKVETYIPEYQVKTENGNKANTNLFQLSIHSSGLGRNSGVDFPYFNSSNRWYLSNGQEELKWFVTNKELLASLKELKLEYPAYHFYPFSRHYSNTGYALLSIALERINNKSITKSIEENILHPLGMFNTGFINEKNISNKLAKGYAQSWKDDKLLKVPTIDVDKNNTVIGAGGLYSTGRDMSKYISFQLSNNKHKEVLSQFSKNKMYSLRIGWSYSYYYPFSLITHDGAFMGYRSHMAFNPDKGIGWIVFINKNGQQSGENGMSFRKLNSKMVELLYDSKNNNTEVINYEKYVGTYKAIGGKEVIEIKKDAKGLYSTHLNDLIDNTYLEPNGYHSFIVKGNGDHKTYYKFIIDKNQRVISLKLGPFVWNKIEN